MSLAKRILLIWGLVIVGFMASFRLPHIDVPPATFLSYCLQVLLLILSVYLMKHETVAKTRFVFLNFAAFFSMSFFFHLYNFVGTILFPEQQMAQHYFFQYVFLGLYYFLLAFAICYLTIDLLFRDFKIVHKYLLTFLIVGGFFGYYYHPYFSNPRYLYTAPEILEWKQLDNASAEFQKLHGSVPTEDELVEFLQARTATPLMAGMNTEALETRVRELYPYLTGPNYMILLLKPIYMNTIYMCVLSVGLILLFFGYQYRKDPPQGAYIEKMMFFFPAPVHVRGVPRMEFHQDDRVARVSGIRRHRPVSFRRCACRCSSAVLVASALHYIGLRRILRARNCGTAYKHHSLARCDR
jgi:hypothetical protein